MVEKKTIDDLFRIITIENPELNSYRAIVELNPQSEIYLGHFPQMPVTPGVCTLEIIKACAEEILQLPELIFGAIRDCKFTHTITPDQTLYLDITLRPIDSNSWTIDSQVRAEQIIALKLRGTLVTQL